MKYKLLLLVLMAGTLVACAPANGERARYETADHCTTSEERAALAQFVVQCATAANPKADEEGEDLVRQCEATGTTILCPTHHHRVRFFGANGTVVEEVDPADLPGPTPARK